MVFSSAPLPLWKGCYLCTIKTHICGGRGIGLYSSILGYNQVSSWESSEFISLWSSLPRWLLVKHALIQMPMFFAQKTPVGQKHENIHGAILPQRTGILRILSFRVRFEARMRLFRGGDEKQRHTSQVRERGSQCAFPSATKGERPRPCSALHQELSPTHHYS